MRRVGNTVDGNFNLASTLRLCFLANLLDDFFDRNNAAKDIGASRKCHDARSGRDEGDQFVNFEPDRIWVAGRDWSRIPLLDNCTSASGESLPRTIVC